jgi:hypothetical protein
MVIDHLGRVAADSLVLAKGQIRSATNGIPQVRLFHAPDEATYGAAKSTISTDAAN